MTKRIEEMRRYFVQPDSPESAEDLANSVSRAVRTMAEIYATGGAIEDMSEESQEWLWNNRGVENDMVRVLGELLEKESKTRRFDHKFMGQIHPQGNKIGVVANMVAAYMNNNTIVKEVSIAEHEMELEVSEWLIEMFGYNANEASANIVTGGTTANIAALWVARQIKFKEFQEAGEDYEDKKLKVMCNEMGHYSLDKACDLLGVELVEVDMDGYKTNVDSLRRLLDGYNQEEKDSVIAIVGLAGETETGLVDDLDALADVATDYGMFFHVDAAYGGPFILTEKRDLFSGIERADSIVVDPHKMMYVPYASGAMLFKNKEHHALIQKCARYLQPDSNEGVMGSKELRNFGFAARIEGSMSTGGVMSTWATKELFGEEGLRALLNHTLELTDYAYKRALESKILLPLHEPEINTQLVGLKDYRLSKEGRDMLISEGKKRAMNEEREWKTNEASLHDELVCQVQRKMDEKDGYYVSTNGGVDKTRKREQGRSAWRMVPTHPFTTTVEVEEAIGLIEKYVSYYVE